MFAGTVTDHGLVCPVLFFSVPVEMGWPNIYYSSPAKQAGRGRSVADEIGVEISRYVHVCPLVPRLTPSCNEAIISVNLNKCLDICQTSP